MSRFSSYYGVYMYWESDGQTRKIHTSLEDVAQVYWSRGVLRYHYGKCFPFDDGLFMVDPKHWILDKVHTYD